MKRLMPVLLAGLLLGTALAASAQKAEPITDETAANVRLVTSIGRGAPHDVAWLNDSTFVVASGINLWRYSLDDLEQPQKLLPVDREILAVAASPFGDRLALCDHTGTTVYDAETMQAVYALDGTDCGGAPHALNFSADGARLLTHDAEYARLWDAVSGAPVASIQHEMTVHSVQFAPDGQVVTRGGDGFMRWWADDLTVAYERRLPPYPASLTPDGAHIAIAENGEVDSRNTAFIGLHAIPGDALDQRILTPATRFAFAGDTVVSFHRGQLQLWDLATGEQRASVPTDTWIPRFLSASPSGKTVLSVTDNTVSVLDVRTATVVAVLDGHMRAVMQVAFSPDGAYFGAVTSPFVRVWNAATHASVAMRNPAYGYSMFAFTADNDVLINGMDVTVERWSPETGEQLTGLGVGGSRIIVLSPDGKTLAMATNMTGNAVVMWDVNAQRELFQRPVSDSSLDDIMDIAFSADGEMLADVSFTGTVNVWRRSDGASIAQISPEITSNVTPRVTGLSFSPNGAWLVFVESGTGIIHRWSLIERAEAAPFEAGCASALDTAFSPDSTVLAVTCDDTIILWDMAEGSQLAVLRGHTATVNAVAFSEDGSTLISGGDDGTVRLWTVG